VAVKSEVGDNSRPQQPKLYQVIIFGVPTDINDIDKQEETDAIKDKRLQERNNDNGQLNFTTTVILSFAEIPPNRVFIGFRSYKTQTFILKPVRCHKCQMYDHIEL